MEFHILNGDALAEKFPRKDLDTAIIICRECLIDGPSDAPDIASLWEMRSAYIVNTYHEKPERYFDGVVKEFEKIHAIPEHAVINLWFEYDAFCQVNMWFILQLLLSAQKQFDIYWIRPLEKLNAGIWDGFGRMEEKDLLTCYGERIELSADDVIRGAGLWKAFSQHNQQSLYRMGIEMPEGNFEHLHEVISACVQLEPIKGGLNFPEQTLKDIREKGISDFDHVFKEFAARFPVYGFGDAQVKRMWEKILLLEH